MELTAKNRANLRKLATYMESLPPQYQRLNMPDFWVPPERTDDDATYVDQLRKSLDPGACNTSACAVGHGYAAGIERNHFKSLLKKHLKRGGLDMNTPFEGDWKGVIGTTFNDYSEVFIPARYNSWEFCFGPNWSGSPVNAAMRIRMVLEFHDAPGFDETMAEFIYYAYEVLCDEPKPAKERKFIETFRHELAKTQIRLEEDED